ncbi:arsenate-mycothiol transferase ArsC [Sphingobacterium sp. NPDC055346]
MIYPTLSDTIGLLDWERLVSEERKTLLFPLIDFIQKKVDTAQQVNLNFICTHNSRRSHLSQVWAQTAALFFKTPDVACYSGGTDETALFPKVAETLTAQGYKIFKISEGGNPVYAIKAGDNAEPIIGFSKKYDSTFNPASNFAAIMTCSQADDGCPFIAGAEKRIPVTFEDPKSSDGSPQQNEVYASRSLQIATEMFYVFSTIKL